MHSSIVIVDDRSTNLRIYAQFVAMMGPEFSAKCFHSAVEALEWLKTEPAELLIVDYRMPEMDGAEFIRNVRARAVGAHIPAIIITARQDRACRIAALDAGATDFLQSPVSHIEFRERALLLLGQYQKRAELDARVDQINQGQAENGSSDINHKSMLEQIIDTTPILINATDRNHKLLFLNSYQAALLDKEPEFLVGCPIDTIFEPALTERELRRNQLVIDSGESIPNYEEKYISGDIELTFHCNKNPLTNKDGQAIGVLTTGVDITARKFAEEHRTHLALHDMLTGLPNRALLAEEMHKVIEKSKTSGKPAALLLLDLDRFKVINDTRGHQAGDLLLRQVSERITNTLGEDDFAARIGGDEFAVIINSAKDIEDINGLCTKLLKQIGKPYDIAGVDQLIGVSIGVALIPNDGDSGDELLRLADLAMYEAKARGRNCHCYYSAELNQIAQFNAEVEADLRDALERQEFFLEYQPIVETTTGQYVGLEALVRWNHPVRGRLMPNEFIRVANDTGLIDRIGQYVINAACSQIAEFNAQNIQIPHIAINVSPRQFETRGMCDEILDAIERHSISSEQLSIEITEELLIDNNQQVHDELATLRANGVQISIDDFGTGYSSLQYLRDLPATRLKIDQTFIARIEHSEADRAIISTISHLAHALGMRVVAEGVETEEQYSLLRAAGCDEIQGYFVGRPLAIAQLHDIFGIGPAYFKIVSAP